MVIQYVKKPRHMDMSISCYSNLNLLSFNACHAVLSVKGMCPFHAPGGHTHPALHPSHHPHRWGCRLRRRRCRQAVVSHPAVVLAAVAGQCLWRRWAHCCCHHHRCTSHYWLGRIQVMAVAVAMMPQQQQLV